MLSLNRKTDYALVALAHLAHRGERGETVSARALADGYGLPRAMLANLMKQLHRADLIESNRGANGGYRLAHRPEAISLSRVIAAIEGPVQMVLCCSDEPDGADGDSEECLACRIERLCPISSSMQSLNGQLSAIFEHLTLRHLLDGRVAEGIREGVGEPEVPLKKSETIKLSIETSRE